MTMQRQLRARITGRVQGVSFRYYTKITAEQLNLKGWVRNNPDGSVACVAQGTQAQLEQFVDFLHEGSPAARVSAVDVEWSVPDESVKNTFEIVR